MTKLSPEVLRAIWDRSLTSEIGLGVDTNDPTAMRHALLTARKEFPDAEAFEDIMTFCPKSVNEVWLVRKTVELPDA